MVRVVSRVPMTAFNLRIGSAHAMALIMTYVRLLSLSVFIHLIVPPAGRARKGPAPVSLSIRVPLQMAQSWAVKPRNSGVRLQ
jgi:hypothetical protein